MRAVIVTVSDTRSAADDASGDELERLLTESGAEIVDRSIVSDDLNHLVHTIHAIVEREGPDLVMTTGGTGFGPRDNTPEATRSVIERDAPGLAEAMRTASLTKTPTAMLSRGVCGIRGRTLIVNLPGSPRAVTECFEVIRPVLKHAVELLRGETPH